MWIIGQDETLLADYAVVQRGLPVFLMPEE